MAYLQQILRQQAQRRPLYENVAIIGCGYVGTALAYHWQEQGHFVTGTTTSPERFASLSQIASNVVVMKGNDSKAMESLLPEQDTVVVSVAPTGDSFAGQDVYFTTYLSTAKNLVKALKQTPRVKQIIYLSSCSVYGNREGNWVDETSPVAPSDLRSQVLCEAEKILLQASSENQRVCILRLGGIYGPGRELIRMFGDLAGMTLPGKGDRFINWIHRDDIVGAIDFARLNELEGIYNLVDDSRLTVKEQVESIFSYYGLPPVYWDSSKPLRRNNLLVSNQKLKAAGYQLVYPKLFI
ncbi:MAG: SDR family oxidoreductase [Calothrix sp. MO_167.B42]|nr:SDR family oxidoreductase [Calothrix sp. MO_167.B42]